MIGICPVCQQGRLLIAREKRTDVVFIACEDCESEWKEPRDSEDPEKASHGVFGEAAFLSLEEAMQHQWKEFIR
jgi:uncharacterized protein (DUF983 family)